MERALADNGELQQGIELSGEEVDLGGDDVLGRRHNGLGGASPLVANNALYFAARDSGQFGVGMHWFAENWGNTDFGFYFLNYHSRLPLLSGKTVSPGFLFASLLWHQVLEKWRAYQAAGEPSIEGGEVEVIEPALREQHPDRLDRIQGDPVGPGDDHLGRRVAPVALGVGHVLEDRDGHSGIRPRW